MSTFLELCRTFREFDTSYAGAANTPTNVTGQTGSMARVVQWIADAAESIDNLHLDWGYLWAEKSWTLTTGSSGAVYTVADLSLTDLISYWKLDGFIYQPTSDSWWPLEHVPWREWRRNQRLGTRPSGEPTQFTVRPDKAIELDTYPTVAATVRAEYFKARVRLAANNDEPLIPENLQRIIRLRAKISYAEREGAAEVLEVATAEYNEMLQRLEAQELPEQEGRSASERSEQIVVRAQ